MEKYCLQFPFSSVKFVDVFFNDEVDLNNNRYCISTEKLLFFIAIAGLRECGMTQCPCYRT